MSEVTINDQQMALLLEVGWANSTRGDEIVQRLDTLIGIAKGNINIVVHETMDHSETPAPLDSRAELPNWGKELLLAICEVADGRVSIDITKPGMPAALIAVQKLRSATNEVLADASNLRAGKILTPAVQEIIEQARVQGYRNGLRDGSGGRISDALVSLRSIAEPTSWSTDEEVRELLARMRAAAREAIKKLERE